MRGGTQHLQQQPSEKSDPHARRRLCLGDKTQWGEVAAMGKYCGERFYMMIDKHNVVTLMPDDLIALASVEKMNNMNATITKIFKEWFVKNETTLAKIKRKLGERAALERSFFDGYEAATLARRDKRGARCRELAAGMRQLYTTP